MNKLMLHKAPLSFAQERLWFIDQYQNKSSAYNVPFMYKISGNFSVKVFIQALQKLFERHEGLRTVFRLEAGMPYQHILPLNPQWFDITIMPLEEVEKLHAVLQADSQHIFNLSTDLLVRTKIYKVKDDYYLSMVMHHIICDAWSMGIIVKELNEFYNSIIENRAINLEKIPLLEISYRDYSKWQRDNFEEDFREHLAYWTKSLMEYPILNFPTDYPRPKEKTFVGNYIDFVLDNTQTKKLRAYCQARGYTLNVVLMGIFYILLAKYSNSQDIVAGTVVANRGYAQEEDIIGFFVNTLAVRMEVIGDIRKYFDKFNDTLITSYQYQELPFEALVTKLDVARDISRNPIFDFMFVFQQREHLAIRFSGTVVTAYHIRSNTAKFDITLFMQEDGDNLSGSFEYNSDIYDKSTIYRLINHYRYLLTQILATPYVNIEDLSILTKEEYQQIVISWNQTIDNYHYDKTLPKLFMEQVQKTPNRPALIFSGRTMTYEELDQLSSQLAHYLCKSYLEISGVEITPDVLIPISINRGLLMVIAILGILKTGAAYVPLDPRYPTERIKFILNEIGAKLLLTTRSLNEKVNAWGLTAVFLDSEEYRYVSSGQVTLLNKPQDLSCVLYTSGTTGIPKGVMITHQSLVNRILQMIEISGITASDNYLFKTNYIFDVSISDLFTHLIVGASITITQEEFNINEINNLIINNRITSLHLVPSQFALVKDNILNSCVTKIYFSGEELITNIIESLNDVKIINYYGPTETGEVTYYKPRHGSEARIIGKAFTNTKIYVLNSLLEPLPVGVVGELYISGVCLAKGYLRQPILTKERFLKNHFIESNIGAEEYARLYKTGDLVKWLPGGNLEFIGRNDSQVKIRGFRIELGEIESILNKYPTLLQSAVLVKEKDSNKYLVAYYVAPTPIKSAKLDSYLQGLLPDYMIPAVYVYCDKMPLNANGKLDRRKLPEPEFKDDSSSYLGPRTLKEKQIITLWEELLGREKISINDNFFRLGGNSILAVRLVNELAKRSLGVCHVKEIFKKNTIRSLCDYLSSSSNEIANSITIYDKYQIVTTKHQDYQPFPLTKVQEAYLLGRNEVFNLGNISSHIYTELIFDYLDVAKLELTFNRIIKRHPSLRTIYTATEQRCLSKVPFYKIKIHDLTEADHATYLSHLDKMRGFFSHQIFKANQFPLFAIEVTKHQYYVLHVSLDALIFDAHSTKIFATEWTKLYRNPQEVLPTIKINFRDYVLKLQEIEHSSAYEVDKKYWLKKIPGMAVTCSLPLQQKPASVKQPTFKRELRKIPAIFWQRLKDKAMTYNISPTTLLLVIYALVLRRWSSDESILINLTLFDRLPLHKDVDKILGDFTILEIFNFQTKGKERFQDMLHRIQEELWTDLQHKLFSGIDVQRELRRTHKLGMDSTIASLVFTSVLSLPSDSKHEFLDTSLKGVLYSITQTSQVWLDNKAYEDDGALIAEWDYVEQLFTKKTIAAMQDAYCYLITYFADNDWNIFIPDFLPSEDLLLIENSNNTDAQNILPTECIHESFLKAAEKYALKTAIISATGIKTYQELKISSNKIANHLRTQGVKKETLVAIYCYKGWEEAACCLGIMIAGGAYLPLNLDWPIMRIEEILKEANCKYVMTTANLSKKLISELKIEITIAILDSIQVTEYLSETLSTPISRSKLDNLAYVIFTSGSTGTPKGVAITHRGAMNTINDINYRFQVSADDKILALSKLSFDLSVYDLFGLLAVGGTIVVPSDEQYKLPEVWCNYIVTEKVTIWNSVPMLMNMLLEYLQIADNSCTTVLNNVLRLVLLSGDKIPIELPRVIKKYMPNTQIISLGGATEGSIWSIIYPIKDVDIVSDTIPYGKAMYNQSMYVLNKDLEYCPVGVTGEIYIGGMGVAKGYWHNTALTQEKFNYHSTLQTRLYSTGDIGRLFPDGNIEFIGRKDYQIKIGGYRVELEEIENVIIRVPIVKECVVQVFNKPPQQKLVCYFVPQEAHNEKLQHRLKRQGIRQNSLVHDIAIKLVKEEISSKELQRYFSRKSYRRFEKTVIPLESISSYLKEFQKSFVYFESTFTDIFAVLSLCLKPYLAHFERNQIFPKYLYPSAGGLYPVQVYVYLPPNKSFQKYNPGFYYYHPDLHQLIYLKDQKKNNATEVVFYFYGYLPAMKSEYGRATETFCFLETGYMVQLLQEALQNIGLYLQRYSSNCPEISFNKDYLLTGSYVLSSHYSEVIKENISSIPLYLIDKQEKKWKLYKWHTMQFNLLADWEPKVEDLGNYGANGEIINDASYLMILGNNYSDISYVDIGIYTQAITEKLLTKYIGSCLLGILNLDEVMAEIIGYNVVHTTIALGHITDATRLSKQVILTRYTEKRNNSKLEEDIKREVEKYLPDYMIPQVFVMLDHMPLNSTGKIDRKLLSTYKYSFHADSSYISPRYVLEKRLVAIWEELLCVKQVGIKDNFFKLGGDSLAAVKLTGQIESQLNMKVKISDIFIAATVEKLAKILSRSNSLIKCFNQQSKKPNNCLIMIHPGSSGCEVYAELADLLKENFNCYGIDNYNIENEDKITDLNLLAIKYVEYLQRERLLDIKPIFLGWSLGGVIALQMVTILEEKFPKMQVYLLDTILADDKINSISDRILRSEFEEAKVEEIKKRGHDEKYINAVFQAHSAETALAKQIPTKKIRSAQLVLFKALQKDETVSSSAYHELYGYAGQLNDNNIAKYLGQQPQIINLDCHHMNILNFREDIADKIYQNLVGVET